MKIEKMENPENFGKYGETYLPEIENRRVEKHIEVLAQTRNSHEFLSLPDTRERVPFRLTIKPDYDGSEFVFDSTKYVEVIQRNQVYHYTSITNLPTLFKYGVLPEAWRNPEQVAGLEGVAIDKGSFIDRYADFDDPNRFQDRRELVTDPHLKPVGRHEKLINKFWTRILMLES